MGIEDPDPDIADQQLALTDFDEDGEEISDSERPPLEADPADVADQHRIVPVIDEDNSPDW